MEFLTGKAIGKALVAACILMIVAGAALLVSADRMPEYTDPARAQALLNSDSPPQNHDERRTYTQQWHHDMATVRTDKWRLYDTGRNFIALSLCILSGMAWFRLWDARNVIQIMTPRSTLWFLLLGSLAWLAYLPAETFALHEELERGYFPHWADSIGIPVFNTATGILVLLPFLIVSGWSIFLRRAVLPANLWIWDSQRRWRSVIWTAVCGTVAVGFATMIVAMMVGGPFGYIPLLLVGLYLTLSARAAIISRPPRRKVSKASSA